MTSSASLTERLNNAKRMLLKYTTMRDTGQFTAVECPVVVAHEIKNWSVQIEILHMAIEQERMAA